MKKLPIKVAKDIAERFGLRQIILLGYDGSAVHVVTYGKSKKDCELAAQAQDFWTGKIREFSFKDKIEPEGVSE
jgi:hypothetical protein